MTPGLITIAGILTALSRGLQPRERDENHQPRPGSMAQRHDQPALSATETIDGMLYVGLRPASHAAA